jgi:hypothetical protein
MEGDSNRERFEKSQAAWCGYRDLSCDYEYYNYEGGSAAPSFRLECLAVYDNHRAAALRKFTFCYRDGCTGERGPLPFRSARPLRSTVENGRLTSPRFGSP